MLIACSYDVIQTPSFLSKLLTPFGSTDETIISSLALIFAASSLSFFVQLLLQALVRFVSQRIEPTVFPLNLTFCHISPPSTPFGTGKNSSVAKVKRNFSSRSTSRASPCLCWDP